MSGPPEVREPMAHLTSLVGELAPVWTEEVVAFLGVAPAAPVVVSLYGGRCVPRTRGSEIVLPAADGPAAALAGLSHELVHAVAGRSPHPLLNEGLAVHVDAELRLAGPAWPFYHLAPHRWMEVFGEEGWRLSLHDLLSTGVGRSDDEARAAVRERAIWYLHAASLTGFLFHRLSRPAFWDTYRSGRPVPAGWDAHGLERDWLDHLGHAPLTPAEREGRDASFRAGRPGQPATSTGGSR